MEVRLVSASGADHHQFLTSVLVGDAVVVDAGSIGFALPLETQQRVRHLFLSHSHMDHVASLPIFLDTVFALGSDCPTVYGSSDVLRALQRDIFNGRLWPDFIKLSLSRPESPFLHLRELQSGTPLDVAGLRITPIDLEHVVPTMGFVIEDQDAAIAIISDTGPTEEIWRIANNTPQLKAVFLEASFPSRLAWLAEQSQHLTPTLCAAELQKLERSPRIIAIHIKAAYRDEVEKELGELGIAELEVGLPGTVYEF